MGLLGLLPLLLALGGIIFIIYYLPMLAKDSKMQTDSMEEIKNNLNIIVRQNEEIIYLLKNRNQ